MQLEAKEEVGSEEDVGEKMHCSQWMGWGSRVLRGGAASACLTIGRTG